MLIFDIGANIGRYAIANVGRGALLPDSVGRVDRPGKIVAVEASPITFERLRDNVKSYSQIEPLHYAVSNTSDTHTTFYHCAIDTISTLDKDWLCSSDSRFGSYNKIIEEVTVPAVSLDKLIEIYGVPDLLKVDVEGAENIVLASLTQKVPVLCFEWAAEWREKNKQCLSWIVSLGFTKFHIQMKDRYDYTPESYDRTADDILTFFDTAKDKIDWGMVWAV